MKRLYSTLLLLFIVSFASAFFQQESNALLQLTWHLMENVSSSNPKFRAALTLKNTTANLLPSKKWKLYFSLRYHTSKLVSLSPEFGISHVSGDLFFIHPSATFNGLNPGEEALLEFTGEHRIANFQDVPSGFFWVDDDDVQSAVPVVCTVINKNHTLPASDHIGIFRENTTVHDLSPVALPKVFPTPVSYSEKQGSFLLDKTVSIVATPEFKNEAQYLAEQISSLLGSAPAIYPESHSGKVIEISSINLPSEAYTLSSSVNKIIIRAGDGAGIFYGIQSLQSMLPVDVWSKQNTSISIPVVEIKDAPRFPIRAFMLDVARNFQSKEQVLRILELMALYKLNVFHFHLNDDEGWRLEIPGLPELTEVGARRGHPFTELKQLHPSYGSGMDGSKTHGSGFYSVKDFIEILKYAKQRHIRVIPEIESPGHARAAVVSMRARYNKYMLLGLKDSAEYYMLHDPEDQSRYQGLQYFSDNVMNAGLPSTYRFIEKVVDEIKLMYAGANAPLKLVHMGGDEVPEASWSTSPAVASFMKENPSLKNTHDLWKYYFERMKSILGKRGLSMAGWEEMVATNRDQNNKRLVIRNDEFIHDQVVIDAWWETYGNDAIPYKLANAGYPTVMACFDYFYLDLSHDKGFHEPGDGWVGYLDTKKIYSFVPYDCYRNNYTDLNGNPFPKGFFDGMEKLSIEGRKNILGLQAPLWGENMVADSLVEYMLVPRLLAFAERSWAADPGWAKETNRVKSQKLFDIAWLTFANILGKREIPKLDSYNQGYGMRVPPPGMKIENGKVIANVQFPGLIIRYTTDGSDPDKNSPVYTAPLADNGKVSLRTFTQSGRMSFVARAK